MEGASSSPSSSQSQPQGSSEMDVVVHAPVPDHNNNDDVPPNIWDWGDLLDFAVDADLSINWDAGAADPPPLPPPAVEVPAKSPVREVQDPGRIRKRDPRMVCSNFLAGRVPCACPEMDEKLMEMEQEEEEAGHGKKRARTARAQPGAARCQVPTCGADIRELKGYHRRHRVCLRCANASTVVIEGIDKRYCQQCGKFHVLPDFDEGKRSCRRKLERHNNRRRRKPADSKGAIEKESQGDAQSEDISGDGETGKDCSQVSSQMAQKETWVDSEAGHASPLSLPHRAPDSKDANSDGFFSLIDSGETQVDGGKHNSRRGLSPSYYENKSAYSSVCPTGRISFKLYDWNPAEFPRRLRHQIFQWLANMPVELEGYIRPGCIILTVFVAMPRFMWMKLSKDPISHIHEFIVAPGGMLSGRGNILVYLNDMVFHVVKGGNSVIKAKVGVRSPRLHYIHPTCFEAGEPMEFVACGSNLLQPKLRFLLSFSGKYLDYNYSPASSHFHTEGSTGNNLDHQLYKIQVPRTEVNCFGPVFIEVENEAGLSNFIPVLIGDKETCSEMKVIQQRLDESLFPEVPCISPIASPSHTCDVSALRQTAISELILDIAWLLKKPGSGGFQQILTTAQVQRLNCLLNLLTSVESTTILEKILQNTKTVIDKVKLTDAWNDISGADLRLLQKYIDYAHQLGYQKLQKFGSSDLPSRNLTLKEHKPCCPDDQSSIFSFPCEDTEIMVHGKLGLNASSTYSMRTETVRLLSRETFSEANFIKEWPSDASCHSSSGEVLSSHNRSMLRFRPTVCLIATAAVCLGICSVLFHPHKVSEFAVSIRRCLSNKI